MRREQYLLCTKPYLNYRSRKLVHSISAKATQNSGIAPCLSSFFIQLMHFPQISLANHDRTGYIVYFPWQSSHLAIYVGIWLLLNLGCTWDLGLNGMMRWNIVKVFCEISQPLLLMCYWCHSSQLTAHTTATTQKEVSFKSKAFYIVRFYVLGGKHWHLMTQETSKFQNRFVSEMNDLNGPSFSRFDGVLSTASGAVLTIVTTIYNTRHQCQRFLTPKYGWKP